MIFEYNSKSAVQEVMADFRWKKRIRKDCVQFVRTGKHLLYGNQQTNGRWLILPLSETAELGKSYTLTLDFQTNYDKQFTIYLLGKDNKTQAIAKVTSEENQWTSVSAKFTVDVDAADKIFITASDFVLSGEVLTISNMQID